MSISFARLGLSKGAIGQRGATFGRQGEAISWKKVRPWRVFLTLAGSPLCFFGFAHPWLTHTHATHTHTPRSVARVQHCRCPRSEPLPETLPPFRVKEQQVSALLADGDDVSGVELFRGPSHCMHHLSQTNKCRRNQQVAPLIANSIPLGKNYLKKAMASTIYSILYHPYFLPYHIFFIFFQSIL